MEEMIYELQVFEGTIEPAINTWQAATPFATIMVGQQLSLPGWKDSSEVERVEHEFEEFTPSNGRRQLLHRVKVYCAAN
jgi:hypothetical protein